jgi:hypothetical protein
MSEVADLPEGSSKSAFAARFGGVGAPTCQRMLAKIESCRSAMPMFQ